MDILSASDIQMDFMRLLITQLQNQNPLEPLDNNEMASQLTQFSQLQQLESMNASFADVLATVQRNYANSLIGKEVSYLAEAQEYGQDIVSGVVSEVYPNIDGEILLIVGSHTLNLEDVISVKA
jgi:flagellar basal-body rod modification protein FlgD